MDSARPGQVVFVFDEIGAKQQVGIKIEAFKFEAVQGAVVAGIDPADRRSTDETDLEVQAKPRSFFQ